MSETPKPSLKDRLLEAIIRRIEGVNDFKQKAELLVKSNKDTIKTMSDLTDPQVDAVATTQWMAAQFPSLKPLGDLMMEYAAWSPSKKGERAKQLTATMVSEKNTVVPYALPTVTSASKKKEKEKEQD